jgi:hypothetical protein
MMNTHTLSKNITYHSVTRTNSTTVVPFGIFAPTQGANDLHITRSHPVTLRSHPNSLNLSQVSKSFSGVDRQSERDYSNYLLDLLTGILTGFADKFIISKKTMLLLSASLTSFLSQPDVCSSYSLAKYRSSQRREWKDRLSIVDFIDFLNNERLNCNSAGECGELSKLISCFKIFILNDIVSSMLTPMRIDRNRQ